MYKTEHSPTQNFKITELLLEKESISSNPKKFRINQLEKCFKINSHIAMNSQKIQKFKQLSIANQLQPSAKYQLPKQNQSKNDYQTNIKMDQNLHCFLQKYSLSNQYSLLSKKQNQKKQKQFSAPISSKQSHSNTPLKTISNSNKQILAQIKHRDIFNSSFDFKCYFGHQYETDNFKNRIVQDTTILVPKDKIDCFFNQQEIESSNSLNLHKQPLRNRLIRNKGNLKRQAIQNRINQFRKSIIQNRLERNKIYSISTKKKKVQNDFFAKISAEQQIQTSHRIQI